MSAVIEAIETLQERGSLELVNGRIRYRGEPGDVVQHAINILRQNRDAVLVALTTPQSGTVPPAEAWPESLLDLAHERAAETGDADTARKEVWISYFEWKAQQLNEIFEKHGNHGPGRKPASITPETVRDGLKKEMRRRGAKQ